MGVTERTEKGGGTPTSPPPEAARLAHFGDVSPFPPEGPSEAGGDAAQPQAQQDGAPVSGGPSSTRPHLAAGRWPRSRTWLSLLPRKVGTATYPSHGAVMRIKCDLARNVLRRVWWLHPRLSSRPSRAITKGTLLRDTVCTAVCLVKYTSPTIYRFNHS